MSILRESLFQHPARGSAARHLLPVSRCQGFLCAFGVRHHASRGSSRGADDNRGRIRALLGGDYKMAARILRPLAESASQPDPIAQFFLALVYNNPQGGRFDQLRACGLFLRSASGAHPFAEQSAALAADIQVQLQSGASLCVAEERWQGGPPLAFDLEPGHRIIFADTSVTVTHGEQEQRGLIASPRLGP